MHNRWLTTKRMVSEDYRGIAIHAAEGVHEEAFALVQKHVVIGSAVVDVGAGAGAFSARLLDAGYVVTALDVDTGKWALESVPLRHLDVNRGISASLGETFDAACVLEVIEHIENPWQLLRELRSVVRPGGWLIVSTPNVTSFLSRVMFLVRGRFQGFDTPNLEYGHINPMTPFEIQYVARQTGWILRSIEPSGYLPVIDLSVRSLRALALNVLRVPVYAIARGEKRGWCILVALQNPA